MNAKDFKYKVTIEILEPQVNSSGEFVRHSEVTIFEQKVINLQVESVIAIVNCLTIPLPAVDFATLASHTYGTGGSNG